jgi:hypothetical protein
MGHQPEPIVKAIGEELRFVRMSLMLTRPQAAKLVQPPLPANTYACYEQGVRPCPLTRLLEICQALGVDPVDVFERACRRVQRRTQCPHCGCECGKASGDAGTS